MKGRAALALSAAAAGTLVSTAATAPASPTVRCRTSTLHPLAGNPTFNFGNSRIAVWLPKHATFVATPEGRRPGGLAQVQADGSIETKLGWWNWRSRRPRLSGRRVDGPSRALSAEIFSLATEFVSARSVRFFPSGFTFPTAGCWRITARTGDAKLVATVKVVKR
jgi:hypothetical protein